MRAGHAELTATLEAMLLRAIVVEWRSFNESRFNSRMQLPLVELTRAEGVLGRWISSGRRMQVARGFVTTATWGAVREVIKHEMAHQFVDEVLGVHMIGPRSTELVAEATLALRLESTVEELIRTIHAHPTMSEAVGEAAHAAHGAAIHS